MDTLDPISMSAGLHLLENINRDWHTGRINSDQAHNRAKYWLSQMTHPDYLSVVMAGAAASRHRLTSIGT